MKSAVRERLAVRIHELARLGEESQQIRPLLLAVRPAHDGVEQLCLLYTSDAAAERSSVDLGGRRILTTKKEKKKKKQRTDEDD